MPDPLFATLTATARFEPLAVLGRGMSGVVYHVRDRETGTDVALKTLETRSPEELYRLKQEFRALADVRHPNLVELYELIVGPSECFFTMELIAGVNFIDHVRDDETEHPTLHVPEAARLQRFIDAGSQLARGVAALHGAGKLHRDIKPNNILVTRTGRVVLLDFGFVTVLGRDPLRDAVSVEIVGTLAYMAPEQLWGQAPAPPADWYSVGVLFYEALTGRLPFERPADLGLYRERRSAPPPLRMLTPWLPERLGRLVGALLDPDPASRPGPDAILHQLENFQTAAAPAARTVVVAEDHPFVGRDREQADLHRAFRDLAGGSPIIVHVHGPSGVGKTELVQRVVSALEANEAAVVLRGRCHPQEVVPYKAFDGVVDSLSRFLMSVPESAAAALVPRHASALVQLFPVLERVRPVAARSQERETADPQEVRRRGFAALRELLTRIADRYRLVVWIDDLQWGDEDSAAVAQALLRPPDPPPLLLLLSYRGGDQDRAAIPSLEPAARHIELGPLGHDEARELARRLAGADAVDFDSIVQEAQGSPLFVSQLMRHLRATRLAANAPPAGESLGLAALLEARFQTLPATARQILEVVCVSGRPLERNVALEAAGPGARARPLLQVLEKEHLVRSTTMTGGPAVDVYHDRIREVVLAQLTAPYMSERHRQLAHTLGRQPAADPEAVFRHLLGGGEHRSAVQWGIQAADRTAAALAFADAARLYAEVLELLGGDDPRRAEIEARGAGALVNAGQGAKAAPLFLSAAESSAGVQRLDLRRRASEQLLVTGHMDEGVALLRTLLHDCGFKYPRTGATAIAAALARLALLVLRGLGAPRAEGAQVPPLEAARLEMCHSAAKGLALVDPIRGLYFAVLSVSAARRSNDHWRIARALAATGAALIPAGGPVARWAARMIDHAREIAARSEDAYLQGFTAITAAQAMMVEARWKEMQSFCDTGTEILRTKCRGVTWEIDIGSMAAMRALEELGELAEMDRRADRLLRESEETADLYGTVSALLIKAFCRLAANQPAAARELAQRSLSLWTRGGFHMQHFYALRLQAHCDLYEDAPENAYARIRDRWGDVRRAGLLRHGLMRTDAFLLRARAALRLATRGERCDEAMLLDAERDIRRLEAEKRSDAVAHGLLLRAGMTASAGRTKEAIELLGGAIERFSACGMELCAALARWRAGELTGGDGGAQLVHQASDVLERQAIASPARFVSMWAPGFPDVGGVNQAGGIQPRGGLGTTPM